ncbi:hypothetical protein GCM10009655_00570 [Rhodoglobus aureus]|uniref:Uncharacterized protein n=1 Tax=Rhodoglobus aureus TaxID=191497 RepID=A0ABP4G123_9MICO
MCKRREETSAQFSHVRDDPARTWLKRQADIGLGGRYVDSKGL